MEGASPASFFRKVATFSGQQPATGDYENEDIMHDIIITKKSDFSDFSSRTFGKRL